MRSMQASTADYRRKQERRLAVARSIWPTSKPASYWPRLNERVWLLPFNPEWNRYANRWADVCVVHPVPDGCVAVFVDGRSTALWWPVGDMVPARTRGIAEGRRLARERVSPTWSGWMEWLRDNCACTEGRVFAARYHSPEAAVWAASKSGSENVRFYLVWLAEPVFGAHDDRFWALRAKMFDGTRPEDRRAQATALLASAEWAKLSEQWAAAALPWQREAVGYVR